MIFRPIIPTGGDFKNCAIRLVVILLAGIIPLLSLANNAPGTSNEAQKGILDLRNTDLDAVPVALHGEWRFYWQQLFQPVEPAGNTPAYIQYPSLWRDNTLNGQTLPSQ